MNAVGLKCDAEFNAMHLFVVLYHFGAARRAKRANCRACEDLTSRREDQPCRTERRNFTPSSFHSRQTKRQRKPELLPGSDIYRPRERAKEIGSLLAPLLRGRRGPRRSYHCNSASRIFVALSRPLSIGSDRGPSMVGLLRSVIELRSPSTRLKILRVSYAIMDIRPARPY